VKLNDSCGTAGCDVTHIFAATDCIKLRVMGDFIV
jgi:hypothetical protein